MSELEKLPDADLAYRAVMLRTLASAVMDEQKRVTAELGKRVPQGDRRTARDGKTKLGSVSITDPKPVARVTDEAAFQDYLSVKYGDEVSTTVELGDPAEICAVLADHGHDDLYRVVETFPEYVRANALRDALVRDVPGVTVTTPDGVVQVRPAEPAKQLVRDMLAGTALIALEGGVE